MIVFGEGLEMKFMNTFTRNEKEKKMNEKYEK